VTGSAPLHDAADLPAAITETHISVVVFVGDRAYKLKKPVRFGFLDFSTREAREAMCHREVELNRRLAPDVYLGVSDVLGVDGEVEDHLVVMRRMPPGRRLATLIADADPHLGDHLRDLAHLLAAFHSRAARGPAIDAAATVPAVRALWEGNFAEMRPFAGRTFDERTLAHAERLVRHFLDGREPLFAARIAGGHIVDGHGDLQCADVFCLPDGPRVLDCIEFDDTFRYGDVANDIAFLAMDLERLGGEALGRRFVAAYEELAGERFPAALLHHYVAYRAQVRAKVAALRAAQEPDGTAAREADVAEARRLLDRCVAHLEAARVRLVIVGGLPGTGKTTVARGLAERLDADLLRSDELRKQLAGLAPTERTGDRYNEGIYSDEATDRTSGAASRWCSTPPGPATTTGSWPGPSPVRPTPS
jgi:hypothetical protein